MQNRKKQQASKQRYKFLNNYIPIAVLILIITTTILSLSYYFTIKIASNRAKELQSIETELKAKDTQLNIAIGNKEKQEKQVEEISAMIDQIKENINTISNYDHVELNKNTLKKQIEDAKNKTESLKKKHEVILNDNHQLKNRLDKAKGDKYQLQEQNELVENKKYQNNMLKQAIEEIKDKKTANDNAHSDLNAILKANIIESISELKTLSEWINGDKDTQFRLIYSVKKHGDTSDDFHLHVDNYSPTIIIIRDGEGGKYGGYTEQSWALNKIDSNKRAIFKEDKFAFLFSLTQRKKYPIRNPSKAILIGKNFLFAFGSGSDLYITEKCLSSTAYNYANFPETYGEKPIKKNEITNFNDYFNVREIEVFHVLK